MPPSHAQATSNTAIPASGAVQLGSSQVAAASQQATTPAQAATSPLQAAALPLQAATPEQQKPVAATGQTGATSRAPETSGKATTAATATLAATGANASLIPPIQVQLQMSPQPVAAKADAKGVVRAVLIAQDVNEGPNHSTGANATPTAAPRPAANLVRVQGNWSTSNVSAFQAPQPIVQQIVPLKPVAGQVNLHSVPQAIAAAKGGVSRPAKVGIALANLSAQIHHQVAKRLTKHQKQKMLREDARLTQYREKLRREERRRGKVDHNRSLTNSGVNLTKQEREKLLREDSKLTKKEREELRREERKDGKVEYNGFLSKFVQL